MLQTDRLSCWGGGGGVVSAVHIPRWVSVLCLPYFHGQASVEELCRLRNHYFELHSSSDGRQKSAAVRAAMETAVAKVKPLIGRPICAPSNNGGRCCVR